MTATMTKAVRLCVIYVRISLDAAGDALGVARQEKLARAKAKEEGLEIAEVITDNGVSAYQRRKRPGFERLMRMLEAGEVTDVIVYSADRLYRRLGDLERIVTVVETHDAMVHTCMSGRIDLSTADGRMIARILGSVAQRESEKTRERVMGQKTEAAHRGDVTSGNAPYGYRRVVKVDAVGTRVSATFEVDEAQAVGLRFMVKALTEGASLNAVAQALDAMGVPTAGGRKRWARQTVAKTAVNPAGAGLRTHNGKVVGDAGWPAIISLADHRAVCEVLNDPRRKVRRPAEQYLLAGMIRNAIDGERMYGGSDRKGDRVRRLYKSQQGCAPACVTADQLDAHVVALVLDRADKMAMPKVKGDDSGDAARKALAKVRANLDLAGDERGREEISHSEWKAITTPLKAREAALVDELAAIRQPSAYLSVLHRGSLRKQWDGLTLDQQRATLADFIDAVQVGPVGRGKRVPIEVRVPPEAIRWRM